MRGVSRWGGEGDREEAQEGQPLAKTIPGPQRERVGSLVDESTGHPTESR